MRLVNLATITVVAAVAVAGPALAGKGGNGHGNGNGGGNPTAPSSSCSVDPSSVAVGQSYVVSASGLPTYTAINLWVTDPSGSTSGMALGSTASGSYSLPETASSPGPWTYTFTGATKPNMDVYASCSVSVS